MRKVLKVLKYLGVALVVLIITGVVVFRTLVIMDPPTVADNQAIKWKRTDKGKNFRMLGANWFRKSETGFWEMHIQGAPFERGVAQGKLQKELNLEQEIAFFNRLKEMIPSENYMRFLKYGISWFNRDLDDFVPEEYKQEIYGIAQSHVGETDTFAFIGPRYQRKLNYHAAHDIGHAIQNMDLVKCTSFAVWGKGSQDSGLIIGRNFDFYVGDSFAKNKVLAFFEPNKGHKFMMVTWPGMIGVTSGMNLEGLTVTLNSAKSTIPSFSRTPVSILAREILQYAGTIQEAYDIARSKETFVTETFLIGSAADGRAAVIEKTPERIAIYDPKNGRLICSNHLQAKEFEDDPLNLEHIEESASMYRWLRTKQMLDDTPVMSPPEVARILRDQRGMDGQDIGRGNEKAMNQLICHHSIIFQPEKRLFWIASAPFQLGKYIAYDLNVVFKEDPVLKEDTEIYIDSLTIPEDTFLTSGNYSKFAHYRILAKLIKEINKENPDSKLADTQLDAFRKLNPMFFETHEILGDYYGMREKTEKAKAAYEMALTKEIPTFGERNRIKEKLAAL